VHALNCTSVKTWPIGGVAQLVGVRRRMVARGELPRWTLTQAGLARCAGQVGKTKEGDVKGEGAKESGGDAAGDAAGPSGMLAAEKAAKEKSKEKEKQAAGAKRTSEGAGLE
jgi:hypothetical protein